MWVLQSFTRNSCLSLQTRTDQTSLCAAVMCYNLTLQLLLVALHVTTTVFCSSVCLSRCLSRVSDCSLFFFPRFHVMWFLSDIYIDYKDFYFSKRMCDIFFRFRIFLPLSLILSSSICVYLLVLVLVFHDFFPCEFFVFGLSL